ncbi:MAG: RelA/SpoT family protein, partial [Candidatus Binataceae bacterium]
HTTVIGPRGQRIEVQIRTREMHAVAEQGIAAHWSYKENGAPQMKKAESFSWLRRLVEWQQNLKDPDEFLSTVKDDLFAEEVFVFTPKGDVLDFPQGATVIDFAYRIHSQVGNHLTGARVNGRMAPLRYKLQSGDTVEVTTSERQSPGKDWANFVVTARAKSRIRQWLRQQQSDRSRELGETLLEGELAGLNLSVAQITARERFATALQEFSYRDADSLLAAVGYGIITPAQFLAKVLTAEELKLYRNEKPLSPSGEGTAPRERSLPGNAVIVSGIGDMMVRFARCCNPLPGEAITGFVTRGRGVTVHVAGCPHALATDPQRRVPVIWKVGDETLRPIQLEVLCLDQPGLLAQMTKAIAGAGVNISNLQVKTTGQEGRALSLFELSVKSAGQLKNLMHSIAAIDGVMRVSRLGLHNGARASANSN